MTNEPTSRQSAGETVDDDSRSGGAADVARFHQELFLRSPDGILLIDPETERALLFNDAACRQLGYSREEFEGLRVSDYEAAENRDEVRAHIAEALRIGGTEFETLQRTKFGEIRNVHVWTRRVEFAGRPAFYTIFRDVTAHRKADADLDRSLDLLHQTGHVARVGGWQLDPGTRRLECTPEVFRILEIGSAEDPTLEKAIALFTDAARPVISAAMRSCIDDGRAFDLELPMVTTNGRPIWVRAKGAAERRNDRTTRLSGTFQDVTERRRANESLDLQSAALHAADDAIVITDRSGTIEWVNAAFTRLTGYAAAEALGKNPRDLVKSGKHDLTFYRTLWETIVSGRTWQGQTINRRKDGTLYTEEQSITPVADVSGAITHFVSIKRDVTARLHLEAQLRQAQKMESVGRLAGGIAHDFNNLLTVINARADLALETLRADDPLREELQEMSLAGERAAVLTKQLLAFSRQQILVPQVLNLNDVTSRIGGLLRRTLGDDVHLVVLPAPGLLNVKADVGQIEQVLVNLAINARDAMPDGGRLTIETQNVTVDEVYALHHGSDAPAGSYVLLSVSDSGVGMDEATRAHLFEPFFTTKGPGKGTGLGLSTVHGIVRQSGGFIGVYSEPGQGSVFKVYLPAVPGVATALRDEPVAQVGGGTETILLVEDDVSLLKLAKRILTSAGYTVHEATRGDEALKLLEQVETPVHLLLTDSVMPGMSGRQLGERLARIRPELKVLHMSGYTSDTMLLRRLSDSETDFLSKPFTAPQLLRKVREVLDS